MRFRHCLGAVLLLAASAPAMADMYLFDGRAWTAGSHQDNRGDMRAEAASPGSWTQEVASSIFADPARAIRITSERLRQQQRYRQELNARPPL